MEEAVVPVGDQLKRSFSLKILGNNRVFHQGVWYYSVLKSKWYSDIPEISVKYEKRGISLKVFLYFSKHSQWKGPFH